MTEDRDPSVAELLNTLRVTLQAAIDLSRADAETTTAEVRALAAAATNLNVIVVAEFGGRLGAVRAPGLVEQVVGAAFQTFEADCR